MENLRSRQLNPCDILYWKSRGYEERPYNWRSIIRQNINNLRSRQLNPCDHLYWQCRGFTERPYDWEERIYGSCSEGLYDDQYYSNEDYEDYEYSDEDYDENYDEDYDEEGADDEYYEDNDNEENGSEYEDDSDLDDDDDYYENSLRSNQLNPNNIEYWRVRGWSYRPDDWRERVYGSY